MKCGYLEHIENVEQPLCGVLKSIRSGLIKRRYLFSIDIAIGSDLFDERLQFLD